MQNVAHEDTWNNKGLLCNATVAPGENIKDSNIGPNVGSAKLWPEVSISELCKDVKELCQTNIIQGIRNKILVIIFCTEVNKPKY